MPSSVRLNAIGQHQARRLQERLGHEARDLRRSANLSQALLAASTGISRQWIAAFEAARLRRVDLHRATLLYAHLGQRLSMKAYPVGEPLRDAAQMRLIERFNARLAPSWRRQLEAPIPIPGDLRAWDELLIGPARIGVEAETRPHDLQLIERSVAGKARDSNVDRVVLLLASTDHNRELVRRHVGALRQTFPLDTRTVLAALGAGRDPGANGLVLL